MMGLTVRAHENGAGSPKAAVSPRADVGEIDTRAPFQSVKAAVTLFSDVVPPKATAAIIKKSKAEERVLEKETQHGIMLRERGYYTNQMRNAEAAKTQALRELQITNRTLQQLTNKLQALNESKQASIKATEDAKIRVKELEDERTRRAQLGDEVWKVDVNRERERYRVTTLELVDCKQELANLRREFDTVSAQKLAVVQKAEEAEQKTWTDDERQSQLSKEVDELRATLEQVKIATIQAQEEYSKLMAEKENSLMSHKLAREEAEKEIERLKEEYMPTETLEEKLQETTQEIEVLQAQLKEIQSTDLYILYKLGMELGKAKKALEEAVAEENSLQVTVGSLKQQVEEVKMEHSESENKALEAESMIEKMQVEIEKRKAQLEAAVSGSAFVMQSSRDKLLEEAKKAKHKAGDIKKNAKTVKHEADAAKTATKEAKGKLKIAQKEAEAAKAAEKHAVERLYNYSGSVRKIRLSVEEYELINKKIEEFRNQADLKVAAANAEVEAIAAREKKISKKLEMMMKENEAIQSEIEDALKRAENAEAAKRMVQSELEIYQNEKRQVRKLSKRRILIGH